MLGHKNRHAVHEFGDDMRRFGACVARGVGAAYAGVSP
ncbi:hypothetical protein SDC9_99837 [bioreactor metagenome]|uniref:Uncharacterized protein n=1 Tax=bioreactor metagenome TaxID=1076179 RepID=A0A645AQE5_9ZZZZ